MSPDSRLRNERRAGRAGRLRIQGACSAQPMPSSRRRLPTVALEPPARGRCATRDRQVSFREEKAMAEPAKAPHGRRSSTIAPRSGGVDDRRLVQRRSAIWPCGFPVSRRVSEAGARIAGGPRGKARDRRCAKASAKLPFPFAAKSVREPRAPQAGLFRKARLSKRNCAERGREVGRRDEAVRGHRARTREIRALYACPRRKAKRRSKERSEAAMTRMQGGRLTDDRKRKSIRPLAPTSNQSRFAPAFHFGSTTIFDNAAVAGRGRERMFGFRLATARRRAERTSGDPASPNRSPPMRRFSAEKKFPIKRRNAR